MANVKISNLPAESDVNNIIGFAGYNASGTCKISGADLINTLPSSSGTLSDVLTAGNTVQDQFINIQTTSDARNTRLSKDGLSMSNFATDLLISQTAGGRLFLNSNSNDVVIQALGSGQVVFNTNEIALQDADVLDVNNSSGSAGEVLSSLGSGNGTEWVAAGGSTPGIVDVLNAGYTANTGQVIALTTGGVVTTYAQTNIQCGGPFSITQGTNDVLTLGSGVSAATVIGGAGAVQVGDTGNNLLISTNGSDKLQLSVNATGEVQFYLGSNNPGPAIGDVLTAKSTAGDVHWVTPSTPNLDISNIDANTIKADLTQSSQPQYGQAVVMEANGAIANGEPVIWDYASGVVTARTPTSNFTQQDAIGIALENIANGASGKILISGFATVKWDGVVSPPVGSEIVLDNSSNGTSIPLSTSIIPFRSVSGGTGSYPSSAGPWTIKFDAGIGNTVKFEIVDFEFEHGTSGSPMYDRGGWVVSPDNNTYSNAQLTPGQNTSGADGWLTSATSTVGTGVWSSSLGSSSSASGYIFPENPTVGNVNIGDIIDLGERFAEYHFRSDGSGNFLGWDLKMFSSGLNPSALTIGQTMQADINSGTFNRLTGYQPGAPIYGYFIGGSTANNAVVCRIAPPRPVS